MIRGIRAWLLAGALVLLTPASAAAFGPLSSVGSFGDGAGELEKPYGVAIGVEGASYVAEFGNGRVSVFAGDGSFLRAFGKDVSPSGGDICTAASGCEQGLQNGSAGAMSSPKGVAFGPEGNVFVADSNNDRIDEYTPEGIFLRAFGKTVNVGSGDPDVCTSECQAGGGGDAAGEIGGPIGVGFDDLGLLYVADPGNHRVDCHGAVYVAEGFPPFRVERFGEPGTAAPPCVESSQDEPIKATLLKVPSSKFRFAGLVKNRRNGTAVLFVRVPGPGRVILKGHGVRRLSRGAPRAMRVRLAVKPKVRLRRYLKQHGKARIRVEVTFKPIDGIPFTREKAILLKRTRGRR